ncbi:LPO_1073/Vpar_1526 family protein [Fibrobacter sp. UWB7]|uniref:LPO_1073/Vpar_1526 family protein n=1 Tax=Fibrobacter sp. UWB7 TaxID=1896206 RepID=UPI00091405B3|nr:LPO_1073/Vpar_1526 family protein [Fibrobacter sp. UWB7]SHM37241.1 hypothetical protein SAMN05720467_1110 [Fibrobacter sp. UWB7]
MDQTQKTGNDCTNLQAGNDINVFNGVPYTEARQIALDVFNANFMKLVGVAKDVAEERANKITQSFLEKLMKENPAGSASAKDPDFQDSLFTVQKEYAKCGDSDMGNILVDLLVDRSREPRRSLKQIVLNESIRTVAKLTENQIAILSVIFILRYTVNNSIINQETFGEYLDKYLLPQMKFIADSRAAYEHLEYAGCGTVQIGSIELSQVWQTGYQGIFSKGFNNENFDIGKLSPESISKFIMKCMNDPTKYQIRALSLKELNKKIAAESVSENEANYIRELFGKNKMTPDEMKAKIVEIRPYMADFYDIWEKSSMKSFQLTSVGIAIGHANLRKSLGNFADLSIWIN